jgi:hypothetical protein
VRRVPGQLLQGPGDDLLDLVQQDGRRPAGRFSSCSPPSRRTNRPRQRATLCPVVRSSAATALFSLPSAQASAIFARSARTWEVCARRAHRCSWFRSASVKASPALPLPRRGLSFLWNSSRLALANVTATVLVVRLLRAAAIGWGRRHR